jgi:cytochrome c5
MKCKTILAGFCLLLLVVACSDSKQPETSQNTETKPATASGPATNVDEPVQKGAAAASDGSCRSILEESCLACHSATRICQKLGQKNKTRWKRTIVRMVSRGTQLSSAGQDALSDCLANESADIVQMCK